MKAFPSLHQRLLLPLAAMTTLALPSSPAADFFVSPTGADTNPGTKASPLRTLAAARDAVRKVAGKEDVTVHVADGIYYLPETLVFTPGDSGTEKLPVVFRAEREGGAVLSGGLRLDLEWKEYKDGIYRASTPAGLSLDQLFINGKCQRMARYPNYDPAKKTDAYQGFAPDAFSKERASRWADPTGGYIHAMHTSRWGGFEYRITGKGADGNVTYEGGWQNNRPSPMHPAFRMVENIFEELDAPGEWFHDSKTNTLYYMPEPGTQLDKAVVEVVHLRHLVEFRGSNDNPVRSIELRGFVFRHASRTFMDTKEPLLRSDWTIYRGGAVRLESTEGIRIMDCEFDQPGGNAVFVNAYNRGARIKGCHIHDTGASGVAFVGLPKAVRNPLTDYGQRHDRNKIDRTPGPKSPDYPAECAVEDCLIEGIGRVERQPAGVQISMARDITVRDCSIYDCVRSGINISEGTWGGHLIERCDVFNTVLETSDHGSFNSWGRDRYWPSLRQKPGEPPVHTDPKLPFLDAMKTTVIRDSRWRCDHGWDIDLDDGSSNYDITNNLMLKGGLKLREGYRRKVWNNICVNGRFHPHVWYEGSGDIVTGNIFMMPPAGVDTPTELAKGELVDRNFYYSTAPAIKDRYAKFGWDTHSLVGDPLFVDPAKGDFQVREGSPALLIGFKNFPMDRFGVKKPSLRAIAKTPEIPPLKFYNVSKAKEQTMNWLGATVRGIQGEEFSAFGTRKEDGGIQLSLVPDSSPAAKAGLQRNDLVQLINGKKTKNLSDFQTILRASGNAPLQIRLVRAQKEMTLDITK